jgi:APA family basic amino acid/polyamine antiporter
MLNYVITIAISAFFAAHYAGGVTFRWFETAPGDVFFGIGLIALLALINTRGVSEAVGVNVVLAVVDFLSQLTIVAVGAVLVLSPEILLRNLEFFGEARPLSQFLLAIPIGTIAYTGIETISNMAGEAKDEDTTIPASIRRVMIAVFAIYFTLADDRPVGAAGRVRRGGGKCRVPCSRGRRGRGLRELPDRRHRRDDGARGVCRAGASSTSASSR